MNDYNSMKYDFDEDEKLRETLNKIIHYDGIDIELVGAWIWVSGNTYAFKKELKELLPGHGFGFRDRRPCVRYESFQDRAGGYGRRC